MDAALASCVTDSGRVDYDRLREAPHNLESYAAHLARVSPESHPLLFETGEQRLAYWINAYNALAMLLALDHPGTPSVRLLDSPAGLLPGAVFLTRRFLLGRRWLSLHAIEQRALGSGDLRVHFALNCASRGCPALPKRAFSAATLDLELDAATRRFLASPDHLAVDATTRTVQLSPLFSWHERAFRNDLPRDLPLDRRIGRRGLVSWVEPWVDDGVRAALRGTGPWTVTFFEWDWSLNSGRKAAASPPSPRVSGGAGSPTPAPPEVGAPGASSTAGASGWTEPPK